MSWLGDYAEDYATLNFKFTTRTTTGVPTTLAGSPVLKVYKANATGTEIAVTTLSVDFDSVTGLNNVLIDLSASAFYAVANDYQVIITTGTVGGTSVVGEVVAQFSIENRFNEVDATLIEGGDATDAIQAATDAALVANHLDHLLKVTYDPATKPGVADALLNELIESDGGVARYTANALEQAPDTTTGLVLSGLSAVNAAKLEDMLDGTGATLTASFTGNLSGSVNSVATEVTADMVKISGDATAADNCESMYDGTGYVGGTIVFRADVTKVDGTAQRATDLAEIARYLIANAAVLVTVVADDSILAQLLAASGDISDYDDTTDSQEAIRDAVDTIAAVGGSGAITFTVTVNDGSGDPMDGVEVWITSDQAGSNVVAGTLTTDASGKAVFMLDAATYYLWKQLAGYNFTNPETIVVS